MYLSFLFLVEFGLFPVIMNSAAMMFLYVSCSENMYSFLLGIDLEPELLSYRVCICSSLIISAVLSVLQSPFQFRLPPE